MWMCETWKSNLTTTNQLESILRFVLYLLSKSYLVDTAFNVITWQTRYPIWSWILSGKHVTRFDQESYLVDTSFNVITWQTHYPIWSGILSGKHVARFDQESYLVDTSFNVITNQTRYPISSGILSFCHVIRCYHMSNTLHDIIR